MTTKPDNVKWLPSPNYGIPRGLRGRKGHKVIAIVNHIMAGTMAGTDSWFASPASGVSAHFGVGKAGEIHQYVEIADIAWHAGNVKNPSWPLLIEGVNPNFYTVGIEHEGQSGDVMPEAQFEATLQLHRWLIGELGIEAEPDAIIGHYRIDSVNKANCPGLTFPWERLLRELGQKRIFPDVPVDHWAAESVARVVAQEIKLMSGYPDGTFRGGQYMTRYELASALDRLLDLIKG
jgi:N-acetyl-anhydromuramyl-L-alanine amidase AmpD